MHIYIGIQTLKVKCTQYGICGQNDIQECKGTVFFKVGQGGQQFLVMFRKSQKKIEGLPKPVSDSPYKFIGGTLTSAMKDIGS